MNEYDPDQGERILGRYITEDSLGIILFQGIPEWSIRMRVMSCFITENVCIRYWDI